MNISQTMNWNDLNKATQHAIIAWKVFGWQWVPYTFYDVSSTDEQVWLLPSPQDVTRLTPGEWTYFLEDDEGKCLGKRYIPYWFPYYTTNLDAAWTVLQQAFDTFFGQQMSLLTAMLGGTKSISDYLYVKARDRFEDCEVFRSKWPLWDISTILENFTPDTICRAVLCGAWVLHENGNFTASFLQKELFLR